MNRIEPLNPYERAIFDILRNAMRSLSTREVSMYGQMSWVAAKKHLEGLHRKRRTVHKERRGRTTLWSMKYTMR